LSFASPAVAQNFDRVAIDREVHAAMKFWNVPGVALVVAGPDKTYLKGYGVRESGKDEPVTPDTIFPLASCTKAFTSLALAILVGDGKLSWEDPVRKHLPEFHLADPKADALVTVRDLLSHRTGVGGHDLLWYRAPWNQQESIRRICKMPPDGPFRSTFAYQSIMYMALGKIAAGRHSRGWDGFVRERILDPLGIAAKMTTTEVEKCTDVANGHRLGPEHLEVMARYAIPEPNPSGSIHLSARELGKWLQFQLSDGEWNGKRLVKAEDLQETHKPQTLIPMNLMAKALNPETVQLSYAMGWVVQDYRGVKVISHSGWIDGFRCQLTLLPDHHLAFGILANLDGTRMNLALSNRMIDLLLDLPEKNWNAHFGQLLVRTLRQKQEADKRRAAARRPDHKPSLPLAEYVGEYEHPAYGVCKISRKGEDLIWEWSSFKKVLDHYDGDTFEIHEPLLADSFAKFQIQDRQVTAIHVLELDFRRRR
jgi:CubicO group peptidase (beta-lactamase class C family)